MVFREFKRLSELRKNQIHSLEAVCQRADGVLCSVFCEPELNFKCDYPAFFFATLGNRTVGVLTLFLPGDGSVEISALVDPEYRRQGICTELLKAAFVTIKAVKCRKILLVSAPGIEATATVQRKLRAELLSSEYKMYMPAVPKKILSTAAPKNARLIPATKKDIRLLTQMNALFFDTTPEATEEWISQLFQLKNVHFFKLMLQDKAVGSIAYVREASGISVFGVGIMPEYRGKGLGRQLMNLLLQSLPAGYPVVLQVSSLNATAFSLYQKLGFAVSSQQDFHLIKQNSVCASTCSPRKPQKQGTAQSE